MKFWQMLTWMEPEQIIEIARFAEELGFTGVMLADHGIYPLQLTSPYPYSSDGRPPMGPESWYPDCWATLGAISAVTTTLRMSISVYVLPLRNPFEVARACGTIDILSGGRFALGAGTGWMKDEFDLYGVDFATRGQRMDEMIDILRAFWVDGITEYHGRHFDFPPAQISPAPGRAVPIYAGGAAPVALRRAAARCDGWIGAGNTAEQVPGVLAQLRTYREAAGRRMEDFETVIGLSTPADAAVYNDLAAHGMTAGVNAPFRFTCGKESSLDAKKRNMEAFANDIIARCP
jgi:probable F420-dependent oxidoreductase